MSEIKVDIERVRGAISKTFEIKDNSSYYSDEWLTQNYINSTFESITKVMNEYSAGVNSLLSSLNNYEEISGIQVPRSLLELLSNLGEHIQSMFSFQGNPVPSDPPSGGRPRRNNGGDPTPNPESPANPGNPTNPDEGTIPDAPTTPDNNENIIVNEALISAAVGALAFQTPITLYSSIGGETVQTSSETEYGLLGVENVEGITYYKVIDKKTGQVYYAKAEDVKIEEDIQVVHTKDNALILNSTDIGSEDNYVGIAKPDSYYIVKETEEKNGVTFASIIDSTTGEKYYMPVSESVEVLSLNQINSVEVVNNNTENPINPSAETNITTGDSPSGTTSDSPSITQNEPTVETTDDNSTIQNDGDAEFSYSNGDTSNTNDTNPEATNNIDNNTSDNSESEYSDKNYVPEDQVENYEHIYDDEDVEILEGK